jgi:hypothetical protein
MRHLVTILIGNVFAQYSMRMSNHEPIKDSRLKF